MAKKPPSRKTAKRTLSSVKSGAKKPLGQKSKKPRESLVSLRADIDNIAARLSDADSMTRSSVKALQQAFSILETRTAEEAHINKAALTLRVDQLSEKLTGLISETHKSVTEEFKTALENPTLESVKQAVKVAEERITKTETAQAEALTKVNRHIASLAKAMDSRLTQDKKDTLSALDQVRQDQTKLKSIVEDKIKTVEQSSASAILRLGERVVSTANDLQEKSDQNTKAISAKISEIAVETKSEFDDYKIKIERRIESLEDTQRNLDSYTDRTIAALTARLDGLEYGLSSVTQPNPYENNLHAVTAHNGLDAIVQDDAFSADPEPIIEPVETPPHPPLALVPASMPPPTQDALPNSPYLPEPIASHAQSFEPKEYTPNVQPYGAAPMSNPAYGEYPAAPVNDPAPTIQAYAPDDPSELFDVSDLPYDNPAYAENPVDTGIERPGSFSADKTRASLLANPKLKAAGLAVAVVTIGYFALRGFGDSKQNQVADQSAVNNIIVVDDGPRAPIAALPGQPGPEQNANAVTEILDEPFSGSTVPNSLQTAADAGNPIAQFQLGLTHLQAGRSAQAAELFRASSSQGQAAAQYELAKMYETGNGVGKDLVMSRQLIERSALAGNRIAMHDIALFYTEGLGDVEPNIKTAAGWFEKAAERGVINSQFNLGVLFESGQGMPKNLSNAYVWYGIAAAQGDKPAAERFEILKSELSAADVKRANARIDAFRPTRINETANGIFKQVPWAVAAEAPDTTSSPAKSQILSAQTLLGQLGYNPGSADGSMGPKTRSAIIKFQQDNGLVESGQVNTALISELQKASGA